MVRYLKNTPTADSTATSTTRYVELACLSTDEKPTEGIATGSIALVVDTSKIYLFDEHSKTWTEWE